MHQKFVHKVVDEAVQKKNDPVSTAKKNATLYETFRILSKRKTNTHCKDKDKVKELIGEWRLESCKTRVEINPIRKR